MTIPAQPAGWYADPSGLPATRWWDGQQWTDHLQPGAAVLPPTAGLGGYFPQVAPSGPLVPGAHTVVPSDPESAPLFATRSTGATGGLAGDRSGGGPAGDRSGGGPAGERRGGGVAGGGYPGGRDGSSGGALPAPAAEQISYAMPPVDGGSMPSAVSLTNDHPALSAADALSAFGNSASPEPDRRPGARHATGLLTHPLLLASLAAVILAALVVYSLLLR
ncbi:hypothetical protein Acy02nite_61890 [Actinoplanes cyaneus]|uniref:DUF2510 domain-containing protein n=1 Tax=Actinoplanes cyaneus TaxID=52696 RepID=A0A919IRN5_9ACTN|nr:DUF2510 domain-containing protein [Actinoplanes cyaneus]MCW2141615.1 Protein of unknown function (DUF2510) [Actinoplanes cyaneus]GID68308.1 hypothetical protein Acy02nite_61890 [Actinoplanes cyaneus]